MPNMYGQLAGGPPDPSMGQPPGSTPDMGGGAIAEALQMLKQAGGSIGDHLDDPAMQPHLVAALQAVKQDPKAQQALAQIGITPDKIQLFEQELQQRMANKAQTSGQPPAGQPPMAPAPPSGAPSWLGAR